VKKAPSSDLCEEILHRIDDVIVAFDREMNYTYVNSRAAELLGRTASDLVGRNYWTEYPEARGRPFAMAYDEALRTKQASVIEDHSAPGGR
jgi:PAS domain S-box-containing protein